MAKLRISPELLFSAFFPDQIDLNVRAASYDVDENVIVLDIFGSAVPSDAQEVRAVIKQLTTTFEKVR